MIQIIDMIDFVLLISYMSSIPFSLLFQYVTEEIKKMIFLLLQANISEYTFTNYLTRKL